MGFTTTTAVPYATYHPSIIHTQLSRQQHPPVLSLSPIDIIDIVPTALSSVWDTAVHHTTAIHTAAGSHHHHLPIVADVPPVLTSLWDTTVNSFLLASDTVTSTVTSIIPHDVLTTLINPSITEDHSALTPEIESQSLNALGHDILLFLAAAVVVDPLGKILGVTPVLLYILLGFVAGPYGLSFFASGTDVNSEIGDIGILFLLFIEGLNLSPERLKVLGGFFSLGATQLILSLGFIFFGLFFGGPYLLPIVQDVRVPIDPDLITLLEKPVIAFSVASAGALSSSAFVLPILKEKGWEKRSDGIAALCILLLQDLAVAPLLVILPLIAAYDVGVGSSATQDPMALGLLIGKATIGFAAILALASVALRRIFQLVARFGSSQTFVATSLLVAAGMGIIADNLGLSSTTGAFAAGVLLAESGYRAQIEADIKPFESILLGVFFVTAGASLDPQTVIELWPTLLAGISAFIFVKFAVVLAAGQFALGLTRADAVRVAILLAGGGEFAFVIFKLANNLQVLPEDLTKLLTASVIISMALTPLLGELASWSGERIEAMEAESPQRGKVDRTDDYDVNLTSAETIREAFEKFDADGSGTISAEELRRVLTRPGMENSLLTLSEVETILRRFDEDGDGELHFDEFAALWTAKRRPAIQNLNSGPEVEKPTPSLENAVVVCGYGEVAQQVCAGLNVPYVAFSRDPARISLGVLNGASVVYGNGASPSLIRSVGIERPSAIVVAYATESRCLEATLRLHEAFPKTPIYVRAARLEKVDSLMKAGATKVVVETKKVAIAFQKLVGLEGAVRERIIANLSEDRHDIPYTERELTELAYVCDMSPDELADLYELYTTSPNRNENGDVQLAELRDELMRRRTVPLDDATLKSWMGYEEFLSKWVTGEAEVKWVTFPEFVRFACGKL